MYRCYRKFFNVRVNQYGSEVFSRWCHADGDGFNRSLEFAVKHSRNILYFRYGYCSFAEIHDTMLGALKTLPVLFAFSFRKAYCMSITEKVLKGGVKIADGIKKSL